MAEFWWHKLLVSLLFLQLHTASNFRSLTLPTLGRPFALGDLYNLKDDNIILGPKLWSSDHLANYTERIQRRTKFEVLASENTQDLKNYFEINARLSLSFMGGLIKVSGSAGYLDDRVKKSNIARVSLKFDTRTFTRELKPELFIFVDYEAVLKKVPGATHVVVGIEYGASAVFAFDREVSHGEIKKDVTGSMQVSIKSLPGVEIEGSAEIKISEEEKKRTDKFTCRFYGDFVLKEHPGTYKEAIKVYKDLPSYLGANYENSVPMTAWLYPLDALPIDKSTEIIHDIRNSLVHEVTILFEELNELEMIANDILDSVVAQYHERIRKNVQLFQSNVHLFTLLLKQQLAKILPDIRSSGEQSSLAKLLSDTRSSPFGKTSLDFWIEDTKQEVLVIETTHTLPNYCRHQGDFDALLLNNKKYTLALTMRLEDGRDDFLEQMSDYIDEAKSIADYQVQLEKREKWWSNQSLISDLQQKGSSFKNFYELEKQKEEGDILKSDIQFLVRETDLAHGPRGITIELYEYAALVNADYHIPSTTGVPKENGTTYDSIKIVWDTPMAGIENIDYYEVETYILSDETNEKNNTDMKTMLSKVNTYQTAGKCEEMQVSALKPERVYTFIINTYSTLGKTASSLPSIFIRTLPCSKGMYYSNERCFDCDPGFYSKKPGSTSCQKCPVGTRSDSGSYECEECPNGTYSIGNQCLPCHPGEYGKYMGATSCQKCPIAQFSDSFGNVECKKCPKNTTTVVTGAKDVSECGGNLATKIEGAIERVVNELRKKDKSLQTQVQDISTRVVNELREKDKSLQMQMGKFESEVKVTFQLYHPGWNGKLVLIQNHDFHASTNFAQNNWQEYTRGFGRPSSSEYWLGLDQLHRLTSSGKWNVIFQVVWWKNIGGSADPRAGSVGRLEMKGFSVASEVDGFRLTLGNMVAKENWGGTESQINGWYSSYNSGHRFSTSDRDNDSHGSLHCAQHDKGGWWFNSCTHLCLNCNENEILYDGSNGRVPASSSMWLKRVD